MPTTNINSFGHWLKERFLQVSRRVRTAQHMGCSIAQSVCCMQWINSVNAVNAHFGSALLSRSAHLPSLRDCDCTAKAHHSTREHTSKHNIYSIDATNSRSLSTIPPIAPRIRNSLREVETVLETTKWRRPWLSLPVCSSAAAPTPKTLDRITAWVVCGIARLKPLRFRLMKSSRLSDNQTLGILNKLIRSLCLWPVINHTLVQSIVEWGAHRWLRRSWQWPIGAYNTDLNGADWGAIGVLHHGHASSCQVLLWCLNVILLKLLQSMCMTVMMLWCNSGPELRPKQ